MKIKNELNRVVALIFSTLSISLSGCEDCTEPKKTYLKPLTDKEKSVIPNKKGETLLFKDNLGHDFYLTCSKNELQKGVFSDTGRKNSCEDNETYWDIQKAEFTGNLTIDNNKVLKIETSIAVREGYGEWYEAGCLNGKGLKYFFIKINKQDSSAFYKQYYTGYVDENVLPAINNFTFKGNLTLDGKLFNNVNFSNIPPCTKNQGFGLDSVYYSTKQGLIRLTTVDGKTYQRVL